MCRIKAPSCQPAGRPDFGSTIIVFILAAGAYCCAGEPTLLPCTELTAGGHRGTVLDATAFVDPSRGIADLVWKDCALSTPVVLNFSSVSHVADDTHFRIT